MYMASAAFVYTPCSYSPRLSCNIRNGGTNGRLGSSSSSTSCSCSSSHGVSFSSGTNSHWKPQGLKAQAMSTATEGKFASSRQIVNGNNKPDHLLVLVHGIFASPSDWTYVEAELKRRLGRNFLIYASSCNTYTKTFSGIDGAGKRLADEVLQVVQKTEGLKRISFLAHSLGGLFARYAVAVLYSPITESQAGDSANSVIVNSTAALCSRPGTIAGLEPVNFITLATPHLGVRGKKQLPFLLGLPLLEKLAAPIAPIFTGRTGSQLFLADVSLTWLDMVGWRTSSIRRETELVKPPRRSLDGYRHVVDVEYCPPVPSDGPHFPPEAAKAKEAAQKTPSTQNTAEYHEILEEEMIRGLQQLGWKKVDVSFHSAFWPFFAHNNIHVKNEWFHNAGTGVVAHVADSLQREESFTAFTASL